ncbi:MAG: hypothetical protein WC331_10490 [Candidatus Omnitrophota bacterium]|jgi:hypothetical protein
MTLSKTISFDHSITEDGNIQVRRITRILEDGVEISKTYHRHVIAPGDDTANEDQRTKSLAGVVHTPEVVTAYRAKQESLKAVK